MLAGDFKGNLLYFPVIFSAIKRFSLLINYFGCSVQPVMSDSVTPWTAARQASLSITSSWSLPKLMSIGVSDAIQPSHPLSFPSPAFSLSQHQGLFKWVSSSHQVAKYWSFSFSISPSNEYSELISFRMHWLDLLAVQGTLQGLSRVFSNTTVQKLKAI